MKTYLAIAALLLGMIACCGGSKTQALEGGVWKLVSLSSIPAEAIAVADDAFTLEFNAADTMAYGRTSCNRFFGKYEAGTDGALHFGNLGATRMMCPGVEYETAFLLMLDAVDRYEIRKGELTLYGNGLPLATFRPTEKPAEAQH